MDLASFPWIWATVLIGLSLLYLFRHAIMKKIAHSLKTAMTEKMQESDFSNMIAPLFKGISEIAKELPNKQRIETSHTETVIDNEKLDLIIRMLTRIENKISGETM